MGGHHGAVLSKPTVHRALKEFYFTIKQLIQAPAARNREDVVKARRDYALRS